MLAARLRTLAALLLPLLLLWLSSSSSQLAVSAASVWPDTLAAAVRRARAAHHSMTPALQRVAAELRLPGDVTQKELMALLYGLSIGDCKCAKNNKVNSFPFSLHLFLFY